MNVPRKKYARPSRATSTPIPADRIAYSVKEAARLLGVSERLVKAQVAEGGSLPSFKCGGRRLVSRAALDAFMGERFARTLRSF